MATLSSPRDTPPPHPRRGLLLWIAVALLALFGIAWGALLILFPPARLRAVVQRQIGSTLQREVRFDGAHLSVWPPVRLTVDNLALAEPGGFASGAAIQARSLNLDLDALALLRNRFVIRRLVLVEPAAHIVLRPDGTTNLSNAAAPAGKKRPAPTMDFEVSRLEIRRGRLLLDDLAASRRTAFGLDAGMSFGITNRGTRVTTRGESHLADVSFGPLSARQASQLNRSLAGLDWNIEHDATVDLPTKRIAFQKLALVLGGTELSLTGVADGSTAPPRVDLRARGAAIDLAQVLDYLSEAQGKALQGIDGSGRLDFDVAIRGPIGAAVRPALRGTVTIRDGEFRYPGARGAITNTSFTVRLAPDSLVIPDLRAQVAGQGVRGRLGMTRFADPLVSFAIQGTLDLPAVQRLLAPKDTELAGRVGLDVNGHGRAKDPGSIVFDGWMRPQNVEVKSPALPKKLEKINGEMRFSQARAQVNQLTVHAGESSFLLDALITRPLALLAKHGPDGGYAVAPAGVEFVLQSRYLDLAELLPPTPGAPFLANARGGGRISIGRLRNQKLDVQQVVATLALEPDVMEATHFTMNAYGGAISGKARFELGDPARPGVTLEAHVDSCLVDQALGAWTGAGKILHGFASSSLDLSVRGLKPEDVRRTLTAQGKTTILNGKLGPLSVLEEIARVTRTPAFKEVTFRDCVVPFQVRNGQIATGPAKLVGPLGEWQIGGVTGFDGTLDYAVSITLPAEVTARLGRDGALAAGALSDESGRVLIDLHVGGTAKQPRVRLDANRMRDRLLGRLGGALLIPIPRIGGLPRDSVQNVDSLRAVEKRYRRAVEDSLKKKVRGLLDDFFKSTKRDTAP